MTQQKSERCTVPEARRKPGETAGSKPLRGGKAAPVEQQTCQLGLGFETAEHPRAQARGADGGAGAGQLAPATFAVPKSKANERTNTSVMMDAVCINLRAAFQKVASNKGAPGPDRESIDEVRERLEDVLVILSAALHAGTYQPGDIRRVWIPKAGGGQRGLGIPNVVDRMVQESVRMVLEPLYEPTFHASSHGFRPGRSCHTAVAEARRHLEEGYGWVVDLDLEKFFDRVNHQRLMARLAERVHDRPLLVLIGRMLKAKVAMPDGVVVSTEEGVPQGGPSISSAQQHRAGRTRP